MILKTKELLKEYEHCGVVFPAVDRVNLELPKGKFVVLMGHSGCGKSTLFHMLAGMVRPTAGTIFYDGREMTTMSQKELAGIRCSSLGYVMQGQNLLKNFTIGENICMPNYMGKIEEDTFEYTKQLLKEFGLENMEMERPDRLSGGEQRRVSIIRALVHHPKLVIADEPTSNLDPVNAEIILNHLKKASEQGTTVLISSHDSLARSYADICWRMEKGIITKE